jgi:hypothetical protein
MGIKDRKLDALLFFNPDGVLIGKQFFRKYESYKGFEFPGEITQFNYSDKGNNQKNPKKELILLTTYSRIILNQTDQEYMYNHKIPINK